MSFAPSRGWNVETPYADLYHLPLDAAQRKVVLVLGGAGAPAHAGRDGEQRFDTRVGPDYIKCTNLDWLLADLPLALTFWATISSARKHGLVYSPDGAKNSWPD